MKKTLSAILLGSLMLPLVACGGGTAEAEVAETTASVQSETVADVAEETAEQSVVPDDLDLNGRTITVGYVDSEKFSPEIIGELDGDVVSEAIYYRNLFTEEKLNITLSPLATDTAVLKGAEKFVSTVLAGDHVWDINNGMQSYVSKRILEGVFANLVNDPYLTLDKPWWKKDYIEEFSIGTTTRYFLFGDINLGMMLNSAAIYVNVNMLENQFMKQSELYDLVNEGKWTMDTYNEMVVNAYIDKNGNGTQDDGDQFGTTVSNVSTVELFLYGTGCRVTTRDKDGIPQLTVNNERTIRWVEKMYRLYNESTGVRVENDSTNKYFANQFINGETLFYPTTLQLSALGKLSEMEENFGVIPFPKMDEEQENYITMVQNGSSLWCVPVTASTELLACVGAVFEEMAYQSHMRVIPAFYEVALKTKYARDSADADMIDLIWNNVSTDFGYCFSANLNYMGSMRTIIQAKTKDFASYYASASPAAIEGLNNLIDHYLANAK